MGEKKQLIFLTEEIPVLSAICTQTNLRLLFQRKRTGHDILSGDNLLLKCYLSRIHEEMYRLWAKQRSPLHPEFPGWGATASTAQGKSRQRILSPNLVFPPVGIKCGRRPTHEGRRSTDPILATHINNILYRSEEIETITTFNLLWKEKPLQALKKSPSKVSATPNTSVYELSACSPVTSHC